MQNVFETVNLAYPSKTKDSITSKKLHSRDFWQIANGVLTRSKSAIPPLINGPEGLASAYGKAETFSRIQILKTQASLYLFHLPQLIWNA